MVVAIIITSETLTEKLTESKMAEPTLSLKLLIDIHEKRVLFAEAGKDFVDFLFHILTMPVGTVMSLLKKQENTGSLSNLYKSIEDLNVSYIQPNKTKDSLLKPAVSPVNGSSLLLLPDSHTTKKFYRCNFRSTCASYVSDSPNAACPNCGNKMTSKASYAAPPGVQPLPSSEGGFVKELVTYMVMDDLVVMPLSTISSIVLLNKLDVKDLSTLEEKVVNFGMDEAVKLLSASMHSNKVLTNVFIKDSSAVASPTSLKKTDAGS
ncbi:hypothetical protein OROMI_011627 [Orobanche minor]